MSKQTTNFMGHAMIAAKQSGELVTPRETGNHCTGLYFFGESMKKEKQFYFVNLKEWKWVETENIKSGKIYYDYSDDGTLFDCISDCPNCNNNSLSVRAGLNLSNNVTVKDTYCPNCDNSFTVCGEYGESSLTPRDEEDDEYFILPEHIVVSD